MTPQAITRLEEPRRYQVLVATMVDELVRLTDEVLDLFDVAMAAADRNARLELDRITKTNASAANDTVRLFTRITRVVLDTNVADSEVRATIFGHVDRPRLSQAAERAAQIERPADGNYLDLLSARYRHVRRFAPHVLAAFAFHTATATDPLLEAVHLLKETQRHTSTSDTRPRTSRFRTRPMETVHHHRRANRPSPMGTSCTHPGPRRAAWSEPLG